MAEKPNTDRPSERGRSFLRLGDSQEGVRHVERVVALFRHIRDRRMSLSQAMSTLGASAEEIEKIRFVRIRELDFGRSQGLYETMRKIESEEALAHRGTYESGT